MAADTALAHVARARVLARVLDSAVGIPGTGVRIGLDPILGLIPGVGDLAGAALSGYIVLAGIRAGAPRAVVVRMLGNIAVDALVGSIPLFGDLFDVGWRSNDRNVALIERHLEAPAETKRGSTAMLVVAVLGLLLIIAGGIALGVETVRLLVDAVR